jgi:HEAT repeat protein
MKQHLTRAAVAALTLAAAPAAGAARSAIVLPAKQDSADAVYQQAREALGRADYARAAEQFGRVAERWPRSPLVEDALYFRAFALYRVGATRELRDARTALQRLNERNPKSRRRADASALDTRICGELARRGDERCAATVAARAEGGDIGAEVGAAVAASVDVAVAGATQAAAAAAEAARVAVQRPEVREAIAEATREGIIHGSGSSARGRTPAECQTPENEERSLALNALMQMDAERAMPVLQRVLARRDRCSELLRRRAVFIVAQKKTPESATILMDAARTDPDAETREQAVFWLARVGDDRSVDFLRDLAARGGDRELRKRAVYSLSQSRSPRATAVLRDVATRGEDLEVRAEAIQWLGRRRDADTSAAFLRSLYPQLQERELKERVVTSLRSDVEENRRFLLGVAVNEREGIELRKQALYAAGRRALPVEQVADLYGRVTDAEMKKQVIYVLGQRNEPVATDRLIGIVRSERDPELRKTAVYWLSRSKDPRAAEFLIGLLDR